jgi:hypothetical protein
MIVLIGEYSASEGEGKNGWAGGEIRYKPFGVLMQGYIFQ